MNKIISIVCMCMFALQTFAAITFTAEMEITLSSTHGEDRTVYLGEGANFSDSYDNGFDAPSPNVGGLYIVAADNSKWLEWCTDNLEGTKIGLTTGSDESYTFTFTGVVGSTYKLFDAVTGTQTLITEGGTYGPFTAAANTTINDRFSIVSQEVYPVTTNAYGYASYSNTLDLVTPAGLTAYTGTVSGEVLDMTEVDYVKAGEGVILKGEANKTYLLTAGTGTDVYGANALIASANWTAATEDAYFLVGNEFKKYTGTEAVPAGKAYLIYTAGGANPAPRRIVMRFNTTTAVENVEAVEKGVKFMENGQIFIRRGENVYNAQGQMVK